MNSMIVYNKGRRTWSGIKNSAGVAVDFNPETSLEMEEPAALRLLADYPRDFTSSKIAAPSTEDLARREQSVRDKETHLKEKEASLDEREKALKEREAALDPDKPKRGRPAKKDEPEDSGE
jgi:hypothetical protein